jgi:TolA-binding protein
MDDHRWERLEKQLRSMKSDQEEMLTHMRVGQESMMKRMEEISVEIKIHS